MAWRIDGLRPAAAISIGDPVPAIHLGAAFLDAVGKFRGTRRKARFFASGLKICRTGRLAADQPEQGCCNQDRSPIDPD